MENDLRPTLLCLDDETDNLDALERLFRKKYHVLKANTAEKAFEMLDNSGIQIDIDTLFERLDLPTGVTCP